MEIDYTPFCTAQGLSDFSQVMSETVQKLKTGLNLGIEARAGEDALCYWKDEDPKQGGIDRRHSICYGRHYLVDGKYNFWMGLVISAEKAAFEITFTTGQQHAWQKCELIKRYQKLKEKYKKDGKVFNYTDEPLETTVALKDECFVRFSETKSAQIIFNFACEVFEEIIILA